MWSPAVKRVPFLLGRYLYTTVREELRSPVTAGQDLGNFEVRRVTAYLEMMGKALLPRASESVLHAEKRRLLAEANDILCLDIPPGTFVTCFYGILDPSSGRFGYANAGHSLPCRRRHDGQAVELRATGMPLGLMTGMGYEIQETVLETGDSTLFYSDGLVEAHNPEHEMFGTPCLRGLLTEHATDAEDLVAFLLEELERFTGEGSKPEDDITLVLLHRCATRSSTSEGTPARHPGA